MLLLHEDWNVLENVSVVHSESATKHVLPGSRHVISETDSGTNISVVILRLARDIGIREWVVQGYEFLESAAIPNCCSANHVVILVPTQAKVQGQTFRELPV